MKFHILEAERRTETGKGAAHRIRSAGWLPAVFYSAKSDPIPLKVNAKSLETALRTGSSEFIRLRVLDGGKATEKMTQIKEIQRDVIKRIPLHIDFWEVAMDQEVEIELPIHLTGTPQGVDDGGVLEQVHRTITVAGRPADLPEVLEVDVTSLKVGDVLHVGGLNLGGKVRVVADDSTPIATVTLPSAVEAAAAETAEGEEGEAEGGEEA